MLGVTLVENLLILALIPAAVFFLVALLTLWPKFTRARYRSGQEWDFTPVFWVANPAGVSSSAPAADVASSAMQDTQAKTARGGARGTW